MLRKWVKTVMPDTFICIYARPKAYNEWVRRHMTRSLLNQVIGAPCSQWAFRSSNIHSLYLGSIFRVIMRTPHVFFVLNPDWLPSPTQAANQTPAHVFIWKNVYVSWQFLCVCGFQDCFEDAYDRIPAWVHTQTHTCMCAQTHAHTQTKTHTHTHAHTHTHTQSRAA